MIFMNVENSKTNKSRKFVLNLSRAIDLRSSKKLFIYNTCKNIRQQYKNKKLKI